VGNRANTIALMRVAAVVDKPRTFFVLEGSGNTFGMGGPVFGSDGKPVGVLLLRSGKSETGLGMAAMLSGPNNLGIMPVVVPIDDIVDSAKQVPPMKPKEAAAKEKEAAQDDAAPKAK